MASPSGVVRPVKTTQVRSIAGTGALGRFGAKETPFRAKLDPRGTINKLDANLRRLGERAARRFGHDVEDGVQTARELALRHIQRGVSWRRILQLVEVDLFRDRSPLRDRPQDHPPGSSTKAVGAPRASDEWAWLSNARPNELALAARLLGPSCAGAHLDRLMREAPLRCPGCGGRGVWVGWGAVSPTKGIQQSAAQRGRAVLDVLEIGQTPLGTDTGDRPLVAQGDDVWLCAACGRWTREPLALMTQERADDLSVFPGHGAPGAGTTGDGRLVAYVDGRLALLDEEAASDYLEAITGGIACDYEEAILEADNLRRCRDVEEPEATTTTDC